MKSVRKRLTYANVMSSIAVFLVVAGGSAFAANQLGKNTVGSKQLKKNAVVTAKIKNGAVTGAKLNLSTIGKVPSAAKADTATTAESAKTAETAKAAKTAESADTAKNAGHATTADSATTAGTANLAKSLPALNFSPITLEHGWAPYSLLETYGGTPSFAKDTQGFVHLEGVLSGTGKTSNTIGILPEGFRPPNGAWLPVGSTNGVFDPQAVNLWITSSGALNIENGAGANDSFVSLAGVEFYVG
jgi:hypothetical protein